MDLWQLTDEERVQIIMDGIFAILAGGRLFCVLGICAILLSATVLGEERDLLPQLERQQREAEQALRLEQHSTTRRDQKDRSARERFQQGVLHEQQRGAALVSRPSKNQPGISRRANANTNVRLQQFGRQQTSKTLQFKITR